MAKSERIRLLTPTFRVSFPDVFVKQVFEGQGEQSGRYACAALFSGFEVKDGRTIIKAPAAWSEKDQAKWNAIVAACNKVSIEAFKKPMKDIDRALYKLPFHRGEEKEYDGYGPGVVYFTMSAKNRRPGIIAKDGITPITQGGPEEFYAGCYARASVNHLTAKGDMAEGRVLETRIVPDQELAEREYQHRDLASYVMENRPELVGAALTVLRGFLVSPLEDRPPPTGFRHREWGDLIAASLVWLGLPDPCLAMGRTQAADPEREAQCDVVRIWAQRYGEQFVTTKQLIDLPLLAETLAGLAGVDTRNLELKGAAAALRNMVGLARLGFKVQRVKGQAHHASRWRLENVGGEIDQELPTVEAPEFAEDPLPEDEKEPWE